MYKLHLNKWFVSTHFTSSGGGGGSSPTTQDVVFGALSRAGVGSGVPTTGTSIVSGNGSGHWQIISGVLCPSVSGDTANLSGGSYSLTMDDASVINITIEANCWSVSTQTEWAAVMAQSLVTIAGKKVRVRRLPNNGVYTSGITGASGTPLRRVDAAGLIIEGDDKTLIPDNEDHLGVSSLPIFDNFTVRGCKNIIFRYLDTDETLTGKFSFVGEAANNCDGITVEYCRIRGIPLNPNGDFHLGYGTGASQYPNLDMLVTNGQCGNINFNYNHITWANRAMNVCPNFGIMNTIGNRIAYYYDDGINGVYGGADCLWTCTDNIISHPVGLHTDSVDPHVDAIRGASSATATTDWTVIISRNIIFHGNSRGEMEGILLSDFKKAGVDSGHFYIATLENNVIPYYVTQSLSVENAKNCVVRNNTIVANDLIPTGIEQILVGLGSTDSTTSGTHTITGNISEAMNYGGTPTLAHNILLGAGGGTIPYANVFNLQGVDPQTVADVKTWFAPKVGGSALISGTYYGALNTDGSFNLPVADGTPVSAMDYSLSNNSGLIPPTL
jgi:hypothetical protein